MGLLMENYHAVTLRNQEEETFLQAFIPAYIRDLDRVPEGVSDYICEFEREIFLLQRHLLPPRQLRTQYAHQARVLAETMCRLDGIIADERRGVETDYRVTSIQLAMAGYSIHLLKRMRKEMRESGSTELIY